MNTSSQFIVFFLFIMLLAFLLISVAYFAGHKLPDKEKNSAYECGFTPFEDARQKFDIRFYLIAILFLVFDLEIIFLFP
jgi:NADH:ubiquinone oxidoreductase subunit 3 (subunit A)